MNKEAKIRSIALKTLEIEARTLQKLTQSIDENFCAAIENIEQSKGRVIITGLGKSALVARKIVATFNSTGTPSIFMHAADAIHGDLGMIRPEDVVLGLSKSGSTAEFTVMVPMIRHLGNTIIAMTGNQESYLARHADIVLYLPIDEEAEPNNLAPTASSIAQMAMGDAMATALLSLRGFSSDDFARFHPGGSLGKQLYLRVADIFPKNASPSVRTEDHIHRIIMEITSKRLGATAVCSEDNQLLGIITDGDLRRMMENYSDFSNLSAQQIMSTAPKTISPGALAVEALELMRNNSITQLVVVDQGNYRGMVHLHDLLQEGLV